MYCPGFLLIYSDHLMHATKVVFVRSTGLLLKELDRAKSGTAYAVDAVACRATAYVSVGSQFLFARSSAAAAAAAACGGWHTDASNVTRGKTSCGSTMQYIDVIHDTKGASA